MLEELTKKDLLYVTGGAICTCRWAGGKAVGRKEIGGGDWVIWCRSYCCSGNIPGVIYFDVNGTNYDC